MVDCQPTRYIPAIVTWFLLLASTGAFYFFLIPHIVYNYGAVGLVISILECCLGLMVVAHLFMTTIMDPGTLPKAAEYEEDQDDFKSPIYKNVEINGYTVRMKWCVTCHFYRPPRSSHCSICNKCIESFDHHCPWVNNCIGRRNYRHFFYFLISLTFHMIFVFVLALMYTLDNRVNLLSKENLVSLIIMGICGLLFVPVIGLAGFHVILVARARTTNEQVTFSVLVTGKVRSGFNPFATSFCGNISSTLCSPLYPSYLKYKNRQSYPQPPVRSTLPSEADDANGEVMIDLPKVAFHNGRRGDDKDEQRRKLLTQPKWGSFGSAKGSKWTTPSNTDQSPMIEQNETMDSKCNLFLVEQPSPSALKLPPSQSNERPTSSEMRYNLLLKEAYGSAINAPRAGQESEFTRQQLPNSSSDRRTTYHSTNLDDETSTSSLLKSQSLNTLGYPNANKLARKNPPPPPPARFTPHQNFGDETTTGDNVRRPLSFTQAIRLHDSIENERLNKSAPAKSNDLKGKDGKISKYKHEIRV